MSFPLRKLTFFAPAKINLYLNVLGKRPDGFHELVSLMERVSLFDRLTICLRKEKGIKLRCDIHELENKKNIVFRALVLLHERFRLSCGFSVFLRKRIPPGSGLGGASSDAAATIELVNKLCRLRLTRQEKYSIGECLGSDVNFFLSGASFAFVFGRGEQIQPVKTRLRISHLLIFPGKPCFTKLVYGAYKVGLTKYLENVKLIQHCLLTNDGRLLQKTVFNSLTNAAISVCGRINDIFERLAAIPNITYGISGSGSAIFVIGENLTSVRKVLKREQILFREVVTV